jgi:hypothetical protein
MEKCLQEDESQGTEMVYKVENADPWSEYNASLLQQSVAFWDQNYNSFQTSPTVQGLSLRSCHTSAVLAFVDL